jgi:hypothetical protein
MNLNQNPTLRNLLEQRWKELSLKPHHVIDDANEREPSLKFERSRFSKWEHGSKGSLTDAQVVWLATRYGIYININFGQPSLNEKGGLQWTIPPYDELSCLQALKRIFSKVAVAKKAKKAVKKYKKK